MNLAKFSRCFGSSVTIHCARRPGARRARGVTALELITIAAILALILSLLLPQLGRARMQGKRAACLARLKGIGTAARVYAADDPNDWTIPVHPLQYGQDSQNPTFIGAYEWGGKSGIGRPDFLGGAGNPLNSKYGTRAGFGPATRPLNDMLYPGGLTDHLNPVFDGHGARRDTQLSLELFHCPSDSGPPRGGHCPDWVAFDERSSYDHFGNSYAANLFMIGSSAGGYVDSNSPYLRPTARIPTPARTLLFEENIGRWAWAAREDVCDFLPGIDAGPLKAIRGWHGDDWTYTRAFADSHAEYQRIYVNDTEDEDGYANHYRSEHLSSYPARPPGTPGSYAAYRCLIIRGPGWAKDTLPAAFIPTGLWTTGNGRPSYEDCVAQE